MKRWIRCGRKMRPQILTAKADRIHSSIQNRKHIWNKKHIYWRQGEIELATSYMTTYENSMNPIDMRRRNIDEFQMEHATVHVLESVDEIVKAMLSEIEDTKNDNEHS